LKSNLSIKFLLFACAFPLTSHAENDWKVNTEITAMAGNYTDSLTMNSQHGTGLRLLGVYKEQWGITAGLQSTRISMAPITQTSTQNQDNWLISAHMHAPSSNGTGQWTFRLDTHRIKNDTQVGDSDGVRVIAPQVSWLSYTLPLKLDLSYARSTYKGSANTNQISSSIGWGFNQNQNWIQARSTMVSNLNPERALGQTTTHGTDFKLTQFLSPNLGWIPTSITLGLERGQKFHAVDMVSQTVYNLPMRNEGGENIAASWKVSNQSELNIQASQNRYFAAPYPLPSHRFKLSIFSAQIVTAW
jgi:hypothetical protein